MINLNLNLNQKMPVQFSSLESLRKAVICNPFKYDGLCFFDSPSDEETMLELVFSECYKNWEVAECGGAESESFDDVEHAVDSFIVELKELGVGW